MLFAFAVQHDLKIRHLDVVTAFLHSDVAEDIYLAQPVDYVGPGNENKVCKLKKAIYGLKQANRSWYKKLESIFTSMGLSKSKNDPCLCYAILNKGYQIIVIVFLDDMVAFYNYEKVIDWFKSRLKNTLSIKDLGPVKKLLGINITRDEQEKTIRLH